MEVPRAATIQPARNYCHGVVVKNISNSRSGRRLGFAAVALSIAVATGLASGTRIAGARRQLHYENRVTSDIYVAPTKPDGSFTADLPPGFYDLRAERGVVLASRIRVDNEDINLGHVIEPPMLDVRRPFEHEGVADTIVDSPAPATANLISGRPLAAMKYGHEALAPFGAPVGTPAPQSTPLGEATPVAAASPGAMESPSMGGY
jgi:hypothetical protein